MRNKQRGHRVLTNTVALSALFYVLFWLCVVAQRELCKQFCWRAGFPTCTVIFFEKGNPKVWYLKSQNRGWILVAVTPTFNWFDIFAWWLYLHAGMRCKHAGMRQLVVTAWKPVQTLCTIQYRQTGISAPPSSIQRPSNGGGGAPAVTASHPMGHQ